MPSNRFGSPLVQCCAVKTDYAARRSPHTDQSACQGRFARRIRPDDPERLPAFERKGHILNNELLPAGHRHADRLATEVCSWTGRINRRFRLGEQRKELAQALPALPRRDKALPV